MKHTQIKYNIQLNIKSIVLYEKLTQESFALFDGSIHKIIPLLYCMIVANNDYKETYEDTLKYLFSNHQCCYQRGYLGNSYLSIFPIVENLFHF